jgi:hypothetical protein
LIIIQSLRSVSIYPVFYDGCLPFVGPTPAVGDPGLWPFTCNGGSGRGFGTPPVEGVEGKRALENGSVKNAAVGLCTPGMPVLPMIVAPPICEASEVSSRHGGCLYCCWLGTGRAMMPSISSRLVSRVNSGTG